MASVVAACRSLALVVLAVVVFIGAAAAGSSNKSFNITNSCSYTVWPAISSGGASSSSAAPGTTGFELAPGQSRTMTVAPGWSAGRVWGRTLCSTDAGTGKFTCVTGDSGSGRQDCAGGNAVPPATIAEFTLDDGSGGMDTYDVRLLDGFNLPLLVAPQGAAPGGKCAPTGCVVDLNAACPTELRVASGTGGAAVACKSACQAFGSPQYCCTGAYGTPNTCKPSAYSELFKMACPRAYSYAYDGAASTFTCAGGDTTYTITFCPIMTNSGKQYYYANTRPAAPEATRDLTHIMTGSSTTPYTAGVGGEKSSSGPYYAIVFATAVLGAVAAMLALIKVFLDKNPLIKVVCFG